jgi:hypothetical protein
MRTYVEDGCGLPVTGLRSRRCDEHKRLRRNAEERVRYHREVQLDRSADAALVYTPRTTSPTNCCP